MEIRTKLHREWKRCHACKMLAADGSKHLAQEGERIKEHEHVTPKTAPNLFRGWNLASTKLEKKRLKWAKLNQLMCKTHLRRREAKHKWDAKRFVLLLLMFPAANMRRCRHGSGD